MEEKDMLAEAYRDIGPSERLIRQTLEKIRKQRLRRAMMVLLTHCVVSAVVCLFLGICMARSPQLHTSPPLALIIPAGLFVVLAGIGTVWFYCTLPKKRL